MVEAFVDATMNRADFSIALCARSRNSALITPEMLRGANGAHEFNSSKAIRELDYAPTPLRDSLEKCYRWYREAGMLP